MNGELLHIDGVKWWVHLSGNYRLAQPICPLHNLRMQPCNSMKMSDSKSRAMYLKCEDCKDVYKLPRSFEKEEQYVIDKKDSVAFRSMKTIDIDGEVTPIAKDRIDSSAKNPYWIEAKLVESKKGIGVVIYAGNRSKKDKSQIFVDPTSRKLSFDTKDTHPDQVFLEVEARFEDGSTSHVKRGKPKPGPQ